MDRRRLRLKPTFTAPWLIIGIPGRGWLVGARMGLIVRAFTRRNLIAVVVGVLIAGAPLVAYDFWLDGLIDRQGQAEVTTAARRAGSLAESRPNQHNSAPDA